MSVDWAILAAGVVGAALSVSGTVLQSVLRNPLAEPYLMGTVGGAALFAAGAFTLGLTALGVWVLPIASFLGSCFSLLLVCSVAFVAERKRRAESANPFLRSSGSTLVLAGFITGGFTGSLNMLVLSYAKPEDFAAVSKWLYGSLANMTGGLCAVAAAIFALVFAVYLLVARRLDVLELGRSEAEVFGVNTSALIFGVIALSSLLTAVSVALAGAIGFVGLVVPHVSRRLVGPRMTRVLPLSAILGAAYLVVSEVVRRQLPGEVPVGVVAAICGAPAIFMLMISRLSGEGRDV